MHDQCVPSELLATNAWHTKLPDGHKVLEGLGHLESLYRQMSGVKEVIDPLVAAAGVEMRLCLGQLIVVVGEAQVFTSTVNV